MRGVFLWFCLLIAAMAQEQHVMMVTAVDRSTGRAISGLTSNDLEFVQDGQPFPMVLVCVMDGPIDVMLVIDSDLPLARQSLMAGIRVAEYEFRGEDRVGMVTVGRKAKLEVPLAGDVRSVLHRLENIARNRSLSVSKQHTLYDAVLLGVQNLPQASPDRKSHIVVLTMLPERESKASAPEVVAAALGRRVVIDSVKLAPQYLPQEVEQRLGLNPGGEHGHLRALCSPTGGESRIDEPNGYLLRQALARIRSRFQIAGETRGSGPVTLRLTPEGKIRYPDVEFRVLSDEVNPVEPHAAWVGKNDSANGNCNDDAIDKMRFYDLRHTHASLLIAEGVHPKKIAERLGHASIKLTMDLYGHLFEGSDKDSADRMQKLFGERRPTPVQTEEAAKSSKVLVFPARKKLA